ncbi:hypothetical protein GYMLUDRAFT_252735 [Collybiopsis luxurians FD-317 M1]|uniref:Uncharacterized protein n=1 Tax=Collybiopsis luxurians FD-317 M1 TaxID=944289 RepID=A0A0D0BMJ9_9AGAR|nr:hypothetical protein GYMLUDRAFT_252735 [Collybiopsis luxurians FD-317 M1]
MSPSKLNPQFPEEDFRPIQLSVIKAIPSAKWNNNSCWLDSSMEVYFIAMAFHDCFRDFKSLTGSKEGQALPSPIFYLYKVFSFRLECGLFKLDNVSDITTIRDQFQQFLYNVKAVTGPVGSYQTAFGWLQNLLTPAHPFPTNSGCVEYFTACTLEVWMCHDPDSGMKHCRLKSYWKLLGWAPPGRDWDQHKGSIQHWFNSMAQVDKAIIGDSQPGCWRQERQDDTITSVCAGSSKQIQILTDIPVLLNIAPDVTAEKFWDFPLEIFIGPKAAAHKKGLVYDLVGVVLTNGNHYVTLTVIPTASKSKAIFAYDGMKNGGYSQYLPGAAAKLIAGQHPAGGEAAKKLFQSQQVTDVEKHLNVSLQDGSLPTLNLLGWAQFPHPTFHEYSLNTPGIPTTIMKQATIPVDYIDLVGKDFQMGDATGEPPTPPSSSPPPSSSQPILYPEFSCKFSPENIPALSYQPPKNYPSANPTFYRGGLLDTDLAGIRNWFYECLGSGDATELELHHLLDYSIAHAHTLLLTYCHFTEETAQFENVDSHILHKAWEHLQEWNGLTVDGKLQQKDGVDVNFEALCLLDKIMFDESQRAGVAGNHQWGLDAGPYEGGGDPQLIGPDVTPYNMRRDGNDDEEVVIVIMI